MRALCCLLLVLLAAPSPAFAGSYSVTYSGGKLVMTTPTWTSTMHAGRNPDGSWSVSYPITYSGTGKISVAAEGPVTATFTWQPAGPGDDPPTVILIKETARAGWGTWNPGATGSRSHGLQSATVILTEDSNWTLSSYSEADGYTLKENPGNSFILSCKPKAQASLAAKPPMTVLAAGFRYKAEVHPVEVELFGVTKDDAGEDHILIGQVCRASIARPLGIEYTNYRWQVPGDVIDSFRRDNNDERGEMVPVPPFLWATASPTWTWKSIRANHWREQDHLSVSVTVDVSAEGIPLGSLTLSREVAVWRPYYGLFNDVRGTPLFTRPEGGGTLRSDPDTGISFDAAVGTPAFFRERLGEAGVAYWVNLVRREHRLRPRLLVIADDASTNGQYWLDNEIPHMHITVPAASTWGRGRVFWVGFSDTPETAELLHRTSVFVDDRFQSYLLYEPPDAGLGVRPVPLYRVDWTFSGTGVRDREGLFGLGPWRFEPPGGIVAITRSGLYNGHPRWEHRYGNPGE